MSDPVVQIEQGKLKGKVSKNYNNFEYFTFKSIPYAKPPVGELRFSVPQPSESWTGVRDATTECNICAQFDKETQTVIGDEDCLYLNVYTPKLFLDEASPKLPVMVFLHGGGFLFGNGTDDSAHGCDFLIDKDVVVVTINYRLGILGFLSLDRKDAPGNMGLRDQVQALKWVQKNIINFSGNPLNVTIFGISAGGASVEYLLLSPMAKGLFHKGIAQSGSSLLHWAFNENVKKLAYQIPSAHGKTAFENDDQLLEYLKDLSTDDLVSASMAAIAREEFRGGIHFGFVPTVEKSGEWETFLDTNPYELLAKGAFNKVPYMTGFCSREGLLMVSHASDTLEKFTNEYKFLNFFPFHIGQPDRADFEKRLSQIYLEGEKIYDDKDAPAIDFFTDVDFLGGIYVAAKLITKHNLPPVYMYEFSYDGNLNYIKKCYNIDRKGACHGDDGGYIVKSSKLTAPLTDTDKLIRNKVSSMWTNFARLGNPTPLIDNIITAKWEPIKNPEMCCLVIDSVTKMKCEIYPERMELYEDVYGKSCKCYEC